MYVHFETAVINQVALCWSAESSSEETVQVVIDSGSSSGGSKVNPRRKCLPAEESDISLHSPNSMFLLNLHLIMELFWALS